MERLEDLRDSFVLALGPIPTDIPNIGDLRQKSIQQKEIRSEFPRKIVRTYWPKPQFVTHLMANWLKQSWQWMQ